jgi:hypothetical protein
LGTAICNADGDMQDIFQMKGVLTMQVGWLSKKWWVSLAAACLINPWLAIADETAVAGGNPPPNESQPVAASEAQEGAPVRESPPQTPEQDQEAASHPPKAAAEPAGAVDGTQLSESGETAAAPSALPVFELAGFYIGMPMGDAKDNLDELLGVESTIQTGPGAGDVLVGFDGYALLTGDEDRGLVRIDFFQKLIDALYGTEGLKSQDFATRFSEVHGIPLDIDVTRRHTAWTGMTPDGLKVTITSTDSDDKILVIEKR